MRARMLRLIAYLGLLCLVVAVELVPLVRNTEGWHKALGMILLVLVLGLAVGAVVVNAFPRAPYTPGIRRFIGAVAGAVAGAYGRGRQDEKRVRSRWAVILSWAPAAALAALLVWYWLTKIFNPGLAWPLGLVILVVVFLGNMVILVLWLGRQLAQLARLTGKVLTYPPRSKRK